MVDRNHQRLLHILEAITSIRKFCLNKNLNDFKEDDLLYSAVLQKFLVIGESVAKLDKHFTDKFDYPWYKPRAFRNFIAHEYFNVLPERIWETIENDLPDLESIVNKILREEFKVDC